MQLVIILIILSFFFSQWIILSAERLKKESSFSVINDKEKQRKCHIWEAGNQRIN